MRFCYYFLSTRRKTCLTRKRIAKIATFRESTLRKTEKKLAKRIPTVVSGPQRMHVMHALHHLNHNPTMVKFKKTRRRTLVAWLFQSPRADEGAMSAPSLMTDQHSTVRTTSVTYPTDRAMTPAAVIFDRITHSWDWTTDRGLTRMMISARR